MATPLDAQRATTFAPVRTSNTKAEVFDSWASPSAAGVNDVRVIEEMLFPLATTSLMILRGGKQVWTYGDVTRSSYLASSRKSILSMLYGNPVARGQIRLDAILSELGIDDDGGLLPIEKNARVRDLLTARSGVYHAAGSPGGAENGPARGSHKPGSFFLYNNWDFNVAGAIFEKCTGVTVFEAFARDLAEPLGMQDFDPARQRMLGYVPHRSRYPGYHFFLSCRDMAKLGQLMINKGSWYGRQLIPADWVVESTELRVPGRNTGANGMGYGYLWWIPTEIRKGAAWVGSFAALGNYGQYIVCLPALDLVVVHRRAVTDEFAIARNLGRTNATPAGGEPAIMPIIDAIVATMRT
jgi:CubicO group peptidase (beta-lactamase class C family)